MIKRYTAILLILTIICTMFVLPARNARAANFDTIYVTAQDFASDLGTWTVETVTDPTGPNAGAFDGKNLNSGMVVEKKPASKSVNIATAGEYYVWARTRDFATKQGTRYFKIRLNGQLLSYEFGRHGVDDWSWENGGKISLPQGAAAIELVALANYARTDGIILTNDPDFTPPNTYEGLQNALLTPREIPTGTSVRVDGKVLDLSQPAVIMDNVVMVPMKQVYEEYGALVNWNASTAAATAVRYGKTLTVKSGDATADINGTTVALDHAAVMAGDVLMVPYTLLNKAFGATCEWYEISKTLSISTPMSEKLIYLRPESFDSLGTWSVDGYDGAFGGINLRGQVPTNNEPPKPETAVPAVATITGRAAGQYRLWARTKDFAANQSPGARFFQIKINGEFVNHIFGKHSINGWKWEDAGVVSLPEGDTVLELVDTSGYWPRVDGILLSADLSFTPPNNYDQMLSLATIENSLGNMADFPAWAKSDATPVSEYTIENGNIRVKFYKVPIEGDKYIIQKQTFVLHNNNWVETDGRGDEFGYMLLYAEASKTAGSTSQFPFWMNTFDVNGKDRTIVTGDIFKSGLLSWLIPTSVTQLDTRTVELSAENDLAKLTATWSLSTDGNDPKVVCKLEAKQQGYFSLGMFNGGEKAAADVDFILDPFRINNKRLPTEAYLVTESYSSAALSLMTLSASKSPVVGAQTTYSVAVDPSSIPNRWATDSNSRFGLGILGKNKGVQPSIFAPLFGSSEANMNAGQAFEFTYRPVTRIGGWYDSYSHMVKNIFGLKDYRQNYYSSLTDASFNMQELAMDDRYSGWDPIVKGHYNMEGRNVASQSDVMTYIQSYLLTEDKDIYERRTLPTLEFMLTRGKPHFTATGPHGGGMNLGVEYSPLSGPIAAYGTSVYGGAYTMTKGLTPALRKIGIDAGPRIGNRDGWGLIPSFSEYVWEYKFTGNQTYLDEAKKLADTYLKDTVYAPQTSMTPDGGFVATSFYPHFSALLDLYEVCGEQKYLDGAAEGARLLMSTIWTQPLAPSEEITIDADKVRETGLKRVGANLFWKGDVRERLGVPDNLDSLQDETVPAWLPSRVGLGLEATSTFRAGNFSNITMTNWAPDFLRLAKYTRDELFETFARNAVIGRFANYPGYYINQFVTYNMRENYPYEGPDLTSVYFHHIPVLLANVQDFLITQAWKWSDGKINFPAVRQQGYVWFNNKHYGFESGDFFDEKDMWLWLKEGLITADNVQIDWVGARKDGVFAAALMNEGDTEINARIRLGSEVVGENFNGDVTVYRATGEKETAKANNGELYVRIPAHGLAGIRVESSIVTAPTFSKVNYEDVYAVPYDNAIAEPVSQSDFGRGLVLQIDPASYYAYVYVTETPETTRKAVLHYSAGGEWKEVENSTYPFEFTIEVEDVNSPFVYYVELLDLQNNWLRSETKMLSPVNNSLKLSDLKVNGETIEGFVNSREVYNIELPCGTAGVPVVTAAAEHEATVEISPAESIPGSTVITLRSVEGQTKVYRVNFTEASPLAVLDSKYTDIQGNELTGLIPGEAVRSGITVKNTGDESCPVALLVVLYDSSNAVEKIANIEAQVAAGETQVLTGGFDLPQDVTGYRVKTFLWDGIAGLKPIRGAVELR